VSKTDELLLAVTEFIVAADAVWPIPVDKPAERAEALMRVYRARKRLNEVHKEVLSVPDWHVGQD